MKGLSFTLSIFCLLALSDCGTLPASQVAEQTLITMLLTGYNKNVRPAAQVSIDITAVLQQIVAMDEKQQIMTSSSFISQAWIDGRLSWDPNAFNNITVVMLPVKSLWTPDTMVLNSADTSGYLTVSDASLASVDYTGHVYMILPALAIRTRCNLFVRKFPFDRQICNINLTSWGQGTNRVVYTENERAFVDISGYNEHPVWKLEKFDLVTTSAADRVPYEDTDNRIISIQLYLQRKPLFFMMNGIFACLILNCVTLLSYALSFVSQIGLCMTCFLTYSVYSLNFSSLFPQQSEYLMIITLYFLLSTFWTLVSMAWFALCNHFITTTEMPQSLEAFCGLLQRICGCCFSTAPADSKTSDVTKAAGDSKPASTPHRPCSSCQELFKWCPGRHAKVNGVDQQPTVAGEETEAAKANPPNDETSENASEPAKSKCNFCSKCDACRADYDKEKAKCKKKKEIEAKCSALNYFMFFWVFVLMFISNIVLWLAMAT